MSLGAGAGETWSRGPTCGDATVEPAEARRPPALARLRGHIPEGTLFRPPTRPLRGDATQANRSQAPTLRCLNGPQYERGGRVSLGAGAPLRGDATQANRSQTPTLRCLNGPQ